MASSPSSSYSSPAMSFHEMSLLNIQFELEDVQERINQLKKKELIDRKILREKYKTGNFSPSKYGLQPSTPVKMAPDKITFTVTSPMSQLYIRGTLSPSASSTVVSGNMPSNVMSPSHDPTLSGLCQTTPVKVTSIMLKTTDPVLVGQCESATINVTTHAPTSTVTTPIKVTPIMLKTTEPVLVGQYDSQTLNVTTHPPTSTVTCPCEQFNPSAFILDEKKTNEPNTNINMATNQNVNAMKSKNICEDEHGSGAYNTNNIGEDNDGSGGDNDGSGGDKNTKSLLQTKQITQT